MTPRESGDLTTTAGAAAPKTQARQFERQANATALGLQQRGIYGVRLAAVKCFRKNPMGFSDGEKPAL
jgi:hypothetical protein